MTQEPRSLEMSVVINADQEAVWKALTDADELTRWFPLEARSDKRVGGQIWWSWGSEFEGSQTIEILDRPQHLRLVDERARPWVLLEDKESVAPVRLTCDFILEADGDQTVLRLVHSGFGAGGGWDDEFDGVRRGWAKELRGLRHYLENHAGRDRRVSWINSRCELDATAAWARFMGSSGFVSDGTLEGLREGNPYRLQGVTGDQASGTIMINDPPTDFQATIHELNDAKFAFWIDRSGDKAIVNVWLSTWGVDADVVDAWEKKWRAIMETLFGKLGLSA